MPAPPRIACGQAPHPAQGAELILLDPPKGTSTGILGSPGQLLLRPVLCGSPAYAPPGGRTSPLPGGSSPCPAKYRYSAADWDAATQSFVPPPPWPALGAVPATPASADAAARPALLDGGDGAYAPRLLLGPAAATGDIADGATAVAATTGEWVVDLHLTASGAALFDQLAERYHHTLIGIDVNGVLLSTPVMLGTHFTTVAIERGGAGGFTEAEATDLAVTLGHPLPVRLQVVSVHAAQGA